jgi:hypothetical protein
MRADVHRQPFVLRGSFDEARDVATQMHARPAPIAGGQNRHLDCRHIGRAAPMPLVVEVVAQMVCRMVLAIALQHVLAERGPGGAFAGIGIHVVRGPIAMLVR